MALTFKPAEVTDEDKARGGRPKDSTPNPFSDAIKGLTIDNEKSALELAISSKTDLAALLTGGAEDKVKDDDVTALAGIKKGLKPADVRKVGVVGKIADRLDVAGEDAEPRVTVRKKFYAPKDGTVTVKFWVVTFKPRANSSESAS